MNDGAKKNYTSATNITADTIFYTNNSLPGYVLTDSVNSIHVYQKSHALVGGIAGLLGGAVLGTVLGGAMSTGDGLDKLGGGIVGFFIGGVAGTIIGIGAGSNGRKVDLDVSTYSKEKRLAILRAVLEAN